MASLYRLYTFMIRCFYIELTTGRKSFRSSIKRAVIATALFMILPSLLIWNHLGLALDNILFPNWSLEKLNSPVFLVGNARSGTTWLHRLLCRHALFTSMKTWEILFAISVSWRVLFTVLFTIDRVLLAGTIMQAIYKTERFLFENIHIHPVGLMEVEEDEWIMVHIAYAQLILFFFPLGSEMMNPIIMFDCESSEPLLDEKIRLEIFKFYKQCVLRHLYFHRKVAVMCGVTPSSNDCIFLSKNPAFTLRITTLYKCFPEAKIVCLLRNPTQSIPSMISYISHVWHAFSDPVNGYPNASDLLDFCRAHYLFPLKHLNVEERPLHQWAFISYHQLVKNLPCQIVKLLDRLMIIKESEFEPTTSREGNIAYLNYLNYEANKGEQNHMYVFYFSFMLF